MRVLIRGRHSARVLERDVMTSANVGAIDGGPQTWGCRQPRPAGKAKEMSSSWGPPVECRNTTAGPRNCMRVAELCITPVPEDCQAGSRSKPPLQTKSTGRTHALSHQSGGRTSNSPSYSKLSPQMPFLSRIKSKQLEKVYKTQYTLQAIILKPTLSTFCWTSLQ